MCRLRKCLLLLDGGTTNTRFTLVENNQILAQSQCRTGAVDAAQEGQNHLLQAAVRREMNALQNRWDCSIEEIYAAGMITSDTGLCEIKHIEAPVDLFRLAASVQVRTLPEISNVPFCFVPGIRFETGGPDNTDMLRGEEAEVFGALDSEDDGKQLFIHFGSHNKIIYVENGSITQAATTLSGELLWAVCNHTILKSSVPRPGTIGWKMDVASVQQGFRTAEQYGLSRALFCARVRQKMHGITQQQTLSQVLGALTYADWQMFRHLFELEYKKVTLYGRQVFADAFLFCLPLMGIPLSLGQNLRVIRYEESGSLSVRGLLKIRQLHGASVSNC